VDDKLHLRCFMLWQKHIIILIQDKLTRTCKNTILENFVYMFLHKNKDAERILTIDPFPRCV